MNTSISRKAPSEYTAVTARHPHTANAAARPASFSRPNPNKREITLAPPTPNRLEMAERNINAGIQTVTAVIDTSLSVSPTKNVSAIL